MIFIYILIVIAPLFSLSERYHTFYEVEQQLLDWDLEFGSDDNPWPAQYPGSGIIYELTQIGVSSRDSLPIYAVKLSYDADQDQDEARVLILGQCHAEEIYGVEIAMEMIDWLLHPNAFYPVNYLDRKMALENTELWIVPTHNPEGLLTVHGDTLNGEWVQDEWYRKNKTDINLNGYQRPAVEKRWREFGEFMASDNGFCPVPIVGNIRLEKHKCEYKDGKILLPDDINIWICEGQHRVLGYKYLWDEFKIKCDIPITLINEKRDEEVVNFFYINQKQKSVQTDLSEINLREYIKKNKVKLHGIKFTDEKQLAVDIVQHLNSDPKGPFYKMIQMTGMSTKSTIKAIPMHNVISEVIPKVSEIVEEEEVKTMTITILNNAWKAIKELMPLSFSDQKEYATLKSAGIYTLNRVIGQSIFNMDSYTHDDFVKMFRSVYLKDIFYHLLILNLSLLKDHYENTKHNFFYKDL